MKKKIASLLVIAIIATMTPTLAFASNYSDMPDNWSKAALEAAVSNGLLKGDNGKILPNESLTRSQMAAIVNRAFGAAEKASLRSYSDVNASAWYYEDMAKAVQMQTFMGSGDKLSPNSKITREEAFVVLARAFKLSGGGSDDLNKFSDKSLVSSWAKDSTASLVSEGYLAGSNGMINPKQNITRAEFAQIMNKMIGKYIQSAGTYTENINENLMINVPGVILKDMSITGNLIVGDGVGNGEVTLDNVTVTGTTVIRGGGEHSIKIIGNSKMKNIIIARVNGEVRFYAEDGTMVGDVIVDGKDDVIIEGKVGTVTVTASDVTVIANNAKIESAAIDGDNSKMILNTKTTIKTVSLNAENSEIVVEKGAEISRINANEDGAKISGAGTVKEVNAKADNITVKTNGTTVTAAQGTTGVVAGDSNVKAGTTVIIGTESKSSSGNSRSGNSNIAVSNIVVTGTGNAITVVDGETLQMIADITPVNATDKTITWSVINVTGTAATIDANGLLTATGVGTVTVTAKNEASKVTGKRDITIRPTETALQAAAEAAVKAYETAPIITLAEVTAAEGLKAAADTAAAAVGDATARTAFKLRITNRAAAIASARSALETEAALQSAAEAAVSTYEAGPLKTLAEVAAAESLKAPADTAAAAVGNAAAKVAFEQRIANRAAAIASARSALEAEAVLQAAAEAAVSTYEAAPITSLAEVAAAESLKAPADTAVAAVGNAAAKAAFELRITNRAVAIASARTNLEAALLSAAETAVAAYEDAPVKTLTDVTAAEGLEAAANEKVALLASGTARTDLENRISAKKLSVNAAKADLAATAAANGFKADHAAALTLTVDNVSMANRTIVDAALTAYGLLSVDARAKLTAEKTLLDSLLRKIEELEAASVITSKSITDLDFATIDGTQAKLTSKPVMVTDFTGNPKSFTIVCGADRIPVTLSWKLSTDFPKGAVMGGAVDSFIQQYFYDHYGSDGISNRTVVSYGFDDTFFTISSSKTGSSESIILEGTDWSYFFSQNSSTGTDDDKSKNRTFTVSDGTKTATIVFSDSFYDIADLVYELNKQITDSGVSAIAEKVDDTHFRIKPVSPATSITIDGADKADFF